MTRSSSACTKSGRLCAPRRRQRPDQAGYIRFELGTLYRLNLKAADASPMPAYSADRLAQLKKEYEFAAKEPSNLRYGYVRAG